MKDASRMSRKHKKSSGIKKVKYDDFQFDSDEEQSYMKTKALNLRPFQPRTESQKDAFEVAKSNKLTFLGGCAGTGKTMLLVRLALEYLSKGLIKKIVITRPTIEAGASIGFLPGGASDKLAPFLMPIYDNFEVFIEKEKLKTLLEEGIIEIVPVAFARGRSFHNAFIIIDESQNLTKSEGYMMLTRIGFDSFMGITYDERQIDLKGEKKKDSFVWDLDRFEGGKNIGFYEFGPEDVVRSDMAKEIVRLYEEFE
jgi:phosphate starvation-inducible PhoH-like protein